MKLKFLVLATLLSLFTPSLHAREYLFEIPVNTDTGQDNYTIYYDSENEYLQVKKKEYTVFSLLAIPTDYTSIIEGQYKVYPESSFAEASIGGGNGEVLFKNSRGDELFGFWIDDKKFSTMDLHHAYLLLPRFANLEKIEACAVSDKVYLDYLGMLLLCPTAREILEKNPTLGYINKVFGTIDPVGLTKTPIDSYAAKLKSATGIEPEVTHLTDHFKSFFITGFDMELAGRKPDICKIYRSDQGYLHLSWSYEYVFTSKKEAENFQKELIREVNINTPYILKKSKFKGAGLLFKATIPMQDKAELVISTDCDRMKPLKNYYVSIGGTIWGL